MHHNDLWFVPEEEVDLPVEWRPPHYIPLPTEPLDILFDAEGYPVILFDPVPQKRRRRVGWDAERQRLFVRMLARVPSVTRAAKAVGMSPRSAYKLLDHPAAESFGRAWDAALEHGLGRLRQSSLARAIEGGEFVPIYRKGKLARIEYRRNDKLAIALLSGRARNVDYFSPRRPHPLAAEARIRRGRRRSRRPGRGRGAGARGAGAGDRGGGQGEADWSPDPPAMIA